MSEDETYLISCERLPRVDKTLLKLPFKSTPFEARMNNQPEE